LFSLSNLAASLDKDTCSKKLKYLLNIFIFQAFRRRKLPLLLPKVTPDKDESSLDIFNNMPRVHMRLTVALLEALLKTNGYDNLDTNTSSLRRE